MHDYTCLYACMHTCMYLRMPLCLIIMNNYVLIYDYLCMHWSVCIIACMCMNVWLPKICENLEYLEVTSGFYIWKRQTQVSRNANFYEFGWHS